MKHVPPLVMSYQLRIACAVIITSHLQPEFQRHSLVHDSYLANRSSSRRRQHRRELGRHDRVRQPALRRSPWSWCSLPTASMGRGKAPMAIGPVRSAALPGRTRSQVRSHSSAGRTAAASHPVTSAAMSGPARCNGSASAPHQSDSAGSLPQSIVLSMRRRKGVRPLE